MDPLLIAVVIVATGLLSWQQWLLIQRWKRGRRMRSRMQRWTKRGRY